MTRCEICGVADLALSGQGLCLRCSETRLVAAIREQHERRGVTYDRPRVAVRRRRPPRGPGH